MVRAAPPAHALGHGDPSTRRSRASFATVNQALSFHTLLVGGNPTNPTRRSARSVLTGRDGGVWFAKGGTNQLVSGMVRHLERLDGSVRLADPVAGIATKDDRATIVRSRSGWAKFDAVFLRMSSGLTTWSAMLRRNAHRQGSSAEALLAVVVRRVLFDRECRRTTTPPASFSVTLRTAVEGKSMAGRRFRRIKSSICIILTGSVDGAEGRSTFYAALATRAPPQARCGHGQRKARPCLPRLGIIEERTSSPASQQAR